MSDVCHEFPCASRQLQWWQRPRRLHPPALPPAKVVSVLVWSSHTGVSMLGKCSLLELARAKRTENQLSMGFERLNDHVWGAPSSALLRLLKPTLLLLPWVQVDAVVFLADFLACESRYPVYIEFATMATRAWRVRRTRQEGRLDPH